MKISKSKQELARIISENGGWRDGAEFAWFQGKLKGGPCHEVWFGEEDSEPEYVPASGSFHSYWSMVVDKFPATKFDNWHQTILSREEYFHLYQATDADGWIEWKGGECPVSDDALVEIKTRDGEIQIDQAYGWNWSHERGSPVKDRQIIAYLLHKQEQAKPEFCESVIRSIPEPSDKPTIEQLAADYRNLLDFARRKQQEADDAKVDAEAKLAELVAAGKALGLVFSVAEPEPELVITDWRDWMIGDLVELINRQGGSAKVGEVGEISKAIGNGDFYVDFPSQSGHSVEHSDIKFILRP